jgi:hypothetical protein
MLLIKNLFSRSRNSWLLHPELRLKTCNTLPI